MAYADLIEDNKGTGEHLNEFLYAGRVKDGVFREHTKEELIEELERVRKNMWQNYSEGAEELGWSK